MKPPVEAYRFTSRLVPLDPGLHGIRYLSQGTVKEPPAIMVQALPVDAGAVDYLPSPGGTPGYLIKPGEMLVLRAHRRVHVVATIVSTSPLGNPESLQLRVEHLDRAPGEPRKSLSGTKRAALPRPKQEALGKSEDALRVHAGAQAQLPPPSVELVESASPTASEPSRAPSRDAALGSPLVSSFAARRSDARAVPRLTFAVLALGARSWHADDLDAAPEVSGDKGVVGVRASVGSGEDSSTQLRLQVRMSDGRVRESLGRDVRIEAVGRSLISGAMLQYRSARTSSWETVLERVFQGVA